MGSYTVLYTFLISLSTLFLIVVITYYLVSIEKKSVFILKPYLLGRWIRMGEDSSGKPWQFVHHFKEDAFEMSATPAFSKKGKYRIIKEQENLAVVELYEIKEGSSKERLHISIDKSKRWINVNGRKFWSVEKNRPSTNK